VLLRLRYWVKKPYKLAKVQSDVNTRIRERVTDADVEMAYPHRHLVFDDTSGSRVWAAQNRVVRQASAPATSPARRAVAEMDLRTEPRKQH